MVCGPLRPHLLGFGPLVLKYDFPLLVLCGIPRAQAPSGHADRWRVEVHHACADLVHKDTPLLLSTRATRLMYAPHCSILLPACASA